MQYHHRSYKGRGQTRKETDRCQEKISADERERRRRAKALAKVFPLLPNCITQHAAEAIVNKHPSLP